MRRQLGDEHRSQLLPELGQMTQAAQALVGSRAARDIAVRNLLYSPAERVATNAALAQRCELLTPISASIRQRKPTSGPKAFDKRLGAAHIAVMPNPQRHAPR